MRRIACTINEDKDEGNLKIIKSGLIEGCIPEQLWNL